VWVPVQVSVSATAKGCLAAVAAVAALVARVCHTTLPRFYFTGYSHPET
jgi:hypothetical protein